jgi:hypothetical protein
MAQSGEAIDEGDFAMTMHAGGPVTALPRTGVGLSADNSISFMMVGSIIALLYIALGFIIRRGRLQLVLEDDGIRHAE